MFAEMFFPPATPVLFNLPASAAHIRRTYGPCWVLFVGLFVVVVVVVAVVAVVLKRGKKG